jgi:signal transduction histidine kinase
MRHDGLMATRTRRLGVRARIAIGFAAVAVAVAGSLAVLAHQRTRSVLLGDRQDAAVAQTFVNARLVRDVLSRSDVDVASLLGSLSTANRSEPLLHRGGRWYGRSVTIAADDVPAALRHRVAAGHASHQRYETDGEPLLGVGVPIPAVASEYYEVVPLDDLDATLTTLTRALLTGAIVAGVLVAGIAFAASRRVLRPLAVATAAARQIAAGDLATRVEAPPDRELVPLVDAFNDMAATLAERVERDRRFAGVVSHELRSPLTSLRTAVEVATSRLPELDERAQVAVDLVVSQLDRFERMALDLLEISRIDAGAVELELQPVDLASCTGDLVAAISSGRVPVEVAPGSEALVAVVDTGRLEWALTNLVENAERHGGGAVAVRVDRDGHDACIHVDDAGPGVPADDRVRVFERFARGAAARGTTGSGLGLALAQEHIRLLGGEVIVSESPVGGARFTIRLPIPGDPA